MEEQPQTQPSPEPNTPPHLPESAPTPTAAVPPRKSLMERAVTSTCNWINKNPALSLGLTLLAGSAGFYVETYLYDLKATQNNQPAQVSHIDAGHDGTVKMESGAALRSMAEKNQGIGICDNNHNREEIPKFLLDHVDDIAATKGIIFLERSQALNDGIKKFYADGNTSHLDSFSFGAQEVTDTYIQLFQKCREKGVEILCYDRDGPMRDPRAQEYYTSPHYMGAGPRRGEENSFPTSIPPELKEGASIFHSERIADNQIMADFVRDTLAARGNPTDCTVYFVCGSYHFTNPELPRIETNVDWVRSKFLPELPPRVVKDLDEQIADILPPGPRKGVVSLDTSLPDKSHIPDGPEPVKYTFVKSSGPPNRFDYDTPEFTLNLPDAVFNRFLAQPEFKEMTQPQRREALVGLQDTFPALVKLESDLKNLVPAKDLSKKEEVDLHNYRGAISADVTRLRLALQYGDLDYASRNLASLNESIALPLPSGARGLEKDFASLATTIAAMDKGLSKSFSPEILLAREIDRLEPPNPFGQMRTTAHTGPTGKIHDTSSLPPDVQGALQKNMDRKIIPGIQAFIADIEKNGTTPKGNESNAREMLEFAKKAAGECRFQDALCHINAAIFQSGRQPPDNGAAAQCLDLACVTVKHAPALIAARAPKEVAPMPREVAGMSADDLKELASITNNFRIEARESGSGPLRDDEPAPNQSKSSFADRFVEERRRPLPPQQEQTNGRTL